MLDPGKVYEFEEFRLDTAREVLQRNDTNVAITKKMFETLSILVENSDRLVEKQELMQRIWHDRFVEDSNLTFNIKMLRKALGDSAANPTFIQTIPRRGYRFIAEVRQPADEPAPFAAVSRNGVPVLAANSSRRSGLVSKRPYLFGLIAAIVLIGSLGFASMLWQKGLLKSETAIFSSGFQSVKITDTGKVHNAVISPDGKYVAYTNITNGKEGLWLRHLETANNTPIIPASDDVYYGLTFSNDGNTLYFVRNSNTPTGPTAIYRVPVFGGVPIKIVEDAQGWISASADGRHIAFVRSDEGSPATNELIIAAVDGKNIRTIKTSAEANYFWGHAFSPDGKTIAAAYGHSSNASQSMGLVEIDIQTGEQLEIMPEKFFHIEDVEWLPDKKGLIFSADKNIGETSKLWQVDYNDRRVAPVTSDLTNYRNISLNHDASSLLATTFLPNFHLSIYDLESPGGFKVLTQARDQFAFTPDGKIVYATDAAGNEDIWIMDADGSNQRQLTNSEGLDFFPIVSSDGRFVYFSSNRSGEAQAWQMNIDGSDQIQITRGEGGYPRFVTPDNKLLYYQSALTKNLMKISLETGDVSPFGGETGFFQSFSPDGTLLAVLHYERGIKQTKVKIVNVDTLEVLRTFSVPSAGGMAYFLRWQTSDTVGYSMNAKNAEDSIWIQNINEESPRLLRTLQDDGIMDMQFSPDGNFGLIRGSWKHDAILLEGLK